jgi:hypothetical protein
VVDKEMKLIEMLLDSENVTIVLYLKEKKNSLPTRLMEGLVRSMYDIAEDFTDESPRESTTEEKDTRVNITV